MGVVVWGSGCFVHKFHWGTLWILSNNPGEIHLQFHLTLKFPPQSSALQLPGLSLHLYSLHIFCKDMQRIFTTTTTTNNFHLWISLPCSPWEVFHPPQLTLSNRRKYLFQSQKHIEMQPVNRTETSTPPSPTITPPASPSIPFILFTGIYAV